MPSSLPRPGVTVIQEFASTSPTIVTPTLVPTVIGPAFEVIDITESDGTLNSDAADGTYDQFPQVIAQTDFPSPRSNIDEVDVLEAEIDVYFVMGGSLYQLENGTDPVNPGGSSSQYGSAFLTSFNFAGRAAMRAVDDGGLGYDLENTSMEVAIDVVSRNNVTQDTLISFPDNTGVNYTATEVAAIINEALGDDYATVIDLGGGSECVQLASLSYGAGSSVDVRGGSTAADSLFTGAGGYIAQQGHRVEGSGFRGQDDNDGDLDTPWIEFYRGTFMELDTTTATWTDAGFPGAGTDDVPGLVLSDADADFQAAHSPGTAVTFAGASPTIPLLAATTSRPGDELYADGTHVLDAEVIEVQAARFKLGTLDTANTTFDDDGNPTSRVYTGVEVGAIANSSPLAPRYAWFQANALQMNNITPVGTSASIEGTSTNAIAALAAELETTITTPANYNLGLLTLLFTITVDGEPESQYTFTFPSGAYPTHVAVTAALAADATLSALLGFSSTDFAGSGTDYYLWQTLATGEDQAISIAPTGTANASLGLSTTAATTITGKDIEVAERAIITSEIIFEPKVQGGEALEIQVTDHLGADTFTLLTTGGPYADIDALALELHNSIPSMIQRFSVAVASGSGTDTGTIVIASREGGVGVSLNVDGGATDEVFSFGEAADLAELVITVVDFAQVVVGDTLTWDGGPAAPAQNVMTEGGVGAWDWAAGVSNNATATSIDAGLQDLIANQGWANFITTAVLNNVVTVTADGTSAGGFLGNLLQCVGSSPIAAITVVGATYDKVATNDQYFTGGEADNDADTGDDYLNGETFGFWLDHATCEYEATFASNSLADAIEKINEEVGGYVVASYGVVDTSALMITSLLTGMASRVEINGEDGAASGPDYLGFNVDPAANSEADGTGRPNPDFWLDISGNVNIEGQIFRNTITGDPDCPVSSTLYIAYRGLRLDLSPMAASPAMLVVDDTTTLTTVGAPINERNPLILGMYFALLNAPGVSVAGIGVDDVSGTEENGTPIAYTRCAEFLEAQEVYALAPLTHSPTVHQLFATHVSYMSEAEQKGERIVLFNPEIPAEELPVVALSGTGEVSAVTNTFLCDDNPATALVANGINPALPLDIDDGVYLEVEVNDVLRRYLVTAVSGVALTLSTTFLATENVDGFYTTTDLAGPVPNVSYSLQIRGDDLVIVGSTLPDYTEIANTINALALTYANRRAVLVFPDECNAEIGGPTLSLPGFYMCAAIAGMVGQQPPQQPFTNLAVTGFVGVVGSNDTFRESQLDVIAGGGVYIMIQEADGAPIICRHQLTTDVTSIETRELSITKAVDYVAKFMRSGLRNYIGKYNITSQFLDTLGSVVQGQLDFLVQTGVIAGGAINQVIQDTDEPDTVIVDVTLSVHYPCNYIRLTLVV
jgi:hypothetical protein